MCRHGDTVTLDLPVGRNPATIDRCLASIIMALNSGGIHTIACCCGHGKTLGNIALADGRELIIAPTFDTARNMVRMITHGWSDEDKELKKVMDARK